MKRAPIRGFTLLEMLVALTIAAILTSASLNVYALFHKGIMAASDGYVRFATEKAKELRCRTRFIRGLPPCGSTHLGTSRMDIRLRF